MSAPAQVNRANAALSTGPKTEEGKATSSQNARAHGLSARKLVLSHEDHQEFDRVRSALHRDFRPLNEFESTCVERIAIAGWRLERANAVEAALFNTVIDQIAAADPSLSSEEAMAEAFINETYAKKLKLFMRYHGAITREYNKALADLRRSQRERRKQQADEAKQNAGKTRAASGIAAVKASAKSQDGFVSHQPPTGPAIGRETTPATA